MKKLDIAALITGVSSLILCVLFFVIFFFVGIKTFATEGGFSQFKEFFQTTNEKINEKTGSGDFINIDDGNDHISIGMDGIFIEDGSDKVIVSPSGVYVSDGSDIVSVGPDGIEINDKSVKDKIETEIEDNVDIDIPVIG